MKVERSVKNWPGIRTHFECLSIGTFPKAQNGRIFGLAFWCRRATFELVFGSAQSDAERTFHLRASSMKPKSLQILVSKYGAPVEACFGWLSGLPYLVLWSPHSTICCRCLGLKIDLLTLSCLEMLPRCQNTCFCLEMLLQCRKVRLITIVVASKCRPIATKWDLLPLFGSRNCNPPIACEP